MSLILRDEDGQTAMMALGLASTKDEMVTVNKPAIEVALKLVYIIAEKWTQEGRHFSIFDVANEFTKQYHEPDPDIAEKLKSPISYDKKIARFARGFMRDSVEEIHIVPHRDTSLLAYFDYLTDKFKADGKVNTSRNIRSTGLRVAKFLGTKVVLLSQIDKNIIADFSHALAETNMTDSTVSFYMRTLKLVLFQARGEGLIDVGEDWFDGINVHIDKNGKESIKLAMPLDAIRKFSEFDFSNDENLALARDIFMFCFYMNGMEWTDAVQLTASSISPCGYIVFNRRQKGVEKRIKIGSKAQEIIDKYNGRTYLFPVLKEYSPTALLYARNSSTRYLRMAGKRAGIDKISFARARATWLALTQQTNIAEQLI